MARTTTTMANPGDLLHILIVFQPSTEGGRTTMPFLKGGGYRPHLIVPPSEEMLGIEFIDGPEQMIAPDQPISAIARLAYQGISYTSLCPGAKFQIREGARTVGHGCVIDLLPPSS